jgi:hypothetical protein
VLAHWQTPHKPRNLKSTLLELVRALYTQGDTVKHVSLIHDIICEYTSRNICCLMTGSGLLVRLPFRYPSFYSYAFHDYYVSFSLNPFGLPHPFPIILYIFYCYITTHSQSLTPHPTDIITTIGYGPRPRQKIQSVTKQYNNIRLHRNTRYRKCLGYHHSQYSPKNRSSTEIIYYNGKQILLNY